MRLSQNSVCQARLQTYCPGLMNSSLYGEMLSLRIHIPGTASIVVVNEPSQTITVNSISHDYDQDINWRMHTKRLRTNEERKKKRSGTLLPLRGECFDCCRTAQAQHQHTQELTGSSKAYKPAYAYQSLCMKLAHTSHPRAHAT